MNAITNSPLSFTRRLRAKLRGLILPALALLLSSHASQAVGVTDAISQGLITVSGHPVSGYSECLIQVANRQTTAVEIDFSTCYFIQSNSSQRIGLSYEKSTSAYLLMLAANTSYSLTFSSRCLDSTRGLPSSGMTFARIELIRSEFSAIIGALRSKATQSQVWAITNGSSPIAQAWRNVDPRVAPPPTTDLELIGKISWKSKGTNLTLKVERLENREMVNSRRLRVALWATRAPYVSGWIDGHLMGSYELEPLRGGYHFRKLTLKTAFNRPTSGTYYTAVTVEEEIDGRWVIADSADMRSTNSF